MSELERLREQNSRYDYACVMMFHKYQELIMVIERDARLSDRFKLWNLKGDMQEAYRAVLDALFGDDAKMRRDIAKMKADHQIIRACQIFNWSYAHILEGYRQQTDYAVKHNMMPKKTAERMYANFKKKFEEEEFPDAQARSFEAALTRLREYDLRHVYEELGEDFDAAHENYERYVQKRKADQK